MDTLETTFFEKPLYVYVTLGFVELALAAVWYERRRRRWKIALAVPPALAVIVAVVAAAVSTDREQIVAAMREIVADVEAGSVRSVQTYLDASYAGHGETKAGALALAQDGIDRYELEKLKLRSIRVTVTGREAQANVTTLITVRQSGLGRQTLPVHWQIGWRKRSEGWRIIDAARPEMGLDGGSSPGRP